MIDPRKIGQFLMGEWDKTKQPLKERATMLPLGQYEDGSVGLAWPGMLADTLAKGQEAAETPIPPINDDEAWKQKAVANFDVTSLAPLGGVLGAVDNAVGVFGGRLAKTADQAALARAEKMAAEGAPREQIWNDTGWFQGVDGKWRFEIDDSNAALVKSAADVGPGKSVSLFDIYSHPELPGAYPEMTDYRFAFTEQYPAGSAAFARLTKDGETRPLILAGLDPKSSFKSDLGAVKTLPHELQHAIQEKEGFATGGNYEFGKLTDGDPLERRAQIEAAAKQVYEQNRAKQATGTKTEDDILAEELGLFTPAVKPWEELTKREQLEWMDAGRYRLYNNLAGEVEARVASKRAPLWPDERRARPPWLDYDVPEADQIVKFSANPVTGAIPGLAAQTQDQDPALVEYLKAVGLY